jgi:zinc protease
MLDKRYPGPDSIQRRELPNGITVLAYENFASQTVAIEGFIRTGALQEDADKAGLSSFTADMLLRGTEKFDFVQIYELLESYGASLDFGSGRHLTQFSSYCLAEDVDVALELMAQALRAPVFVESQVERVRGQIETELQIRANDTGRMASLAFMESLYKDHPYGRSVHGNIETIERIRSDDLVTFHSLHYGPKGMVIGIAGAIRGEKALDKVSEAFGDWVNMKQPVLPSVPDMPRPASEIVRMVPIPGKSQVDLVLGLPGPRRSAPDYLHASLMNTILGVFGMMGRIGRNVREEQGLAYYASSHLAGSLGPAPWSANAGTAPEDVNGVISGIKREITRMQNEMVPAAELADCKSYRVGSLPVNLETNTALADTLVDMELYGLGLDFLQRFPILIQSISAEQVQAAAQKYLSDEELVIALAGSFPVV